MKIIFSKIYVCFSKSIKMLHITRFFFKMLFLKNIHILCKNNYKYVFQRVVLFQLLFNFAFDGFPLEYFRIRCSFWQLQLEVVFQRATSQILQMGTVINFGTTVLYVDFSNRVWDTSVSYADVLTWPYSLQRSWMTVKIMEP